MINYILDTLWEFWQYMKKDRMVYLSGLPYKGKYILICMVPEGIPLKTGWEKLTESMSVSQAEKRIQYFKLARVGKTEKLPKIGT